MNMEFNKHINEYMVYCHSRQLRPKTMHSYEGTLRLFEKWCRDEMGIEDVDKITESTIRHYIADIQQRGKNRTFAKAASFVGSNEYNLLQDARRDYPTYQVTLRSIKKKEDKESYRGLTYQYMENYL